MMVVGKMSLRHQCRYGRFSSIVNIFTCSNTSAVASKAPHCLEELVTVNTLFISTLMGISKTYLQAVIDSYNQHTWDGVLPTSSP